MNTTKNYNLPKVTTPENLETHLTCSSATILTFGDKVLVSAYTYNPNGRCYYGAIYRFTTADHSIEGEIELVAASNETFEDNGHAIAWAIAF